MVTWEVERDPKLRCEGLQKKSEILRKGFSCEKRKKKQKTKNTTVCELLSSSHSLILVPKN